MTTTIRYFTHAEGFAVQDSRKPIGATPNVLALLIFAMPISVVAAVAVVMKYDLHWLVGVPVFSVCTSVIVPLLALGAKLTQKPRVAKDKTAKTVKKTQDNAST